MRTLELVRNEVENRRGDDVSTRWELSPLDGLTWFEETGPLMTLYTAWRRAAGDKKLPLPADFDLLAVIAETEAKVRVVQSHTGSVRLLERDADNVDWQRAILSENERLWIQMDLFAVKQFGEPAYHHIDQFIDGAHRRFSRLLLPIAGETRSVADILMAENPNVQAFVASNA